MIIDLSGRTAVVTGGSAGIGYAAVKLFLDAGANVAFCGRDKRKLSDVSIKLQKKYHKKKYFSLQCDVLNKAHVESFSKAVEDHFGGTDMLINNAGQARLSTFSSTSDEEWRDELELKFFSIINTSRAFVPQLEKSDIAAIVCTSSLLARQPEPHLLATSAARAGQLALIHGMAQEFVKKSIRVNSVLIAQVESDQWRKRFEALDDKDMTWEDYTKDIAITSGVPLERMGKPEEAANAIFFLATPMSSFTTGSTVDVSGGLSRHVG
ncbi:MAG: SDR family oxidoreductase [Pseudomonadota bacterium]|nr:SDR family oxidoreductase [Pseudomonadota bacterium]